ncbi:MAG: ATP-binding cassette domain-containing protein [Nannocystaceae bacterium]
MIDFVCVGKTYRTGKGTVVALREFTLNIGGGECMGLIGPSGSGKSTALRLVNRLVDPTSGSVRFEGRDLHSHSLVELRHKIGYVVQDGGLFPHLTVAENVGLLCRLVGQTRREVSRRVSTLLELVALEPSEFAPRYPRELSGGQCQRVGVARALALDPPCVLLDEPFSALDPLTRDAIHGDFERLVQTLGKTVLLVTHDLREAFRLARRCALLHAGGLMQVGNAAAFLEHPETPFVETFVREGMRQSGSAPHVTA